VILKDIILLHKRYEYQFQMYVSYLIT